ncbi:MAG: hypothetical protein ACI3ZD_01775, partial [Prevotella sp.]
ISAIATTNAKTTIPSKIFRVLLLFSIYKYVYFVFLGCKDMKSFAKFQIFSLINLLLSNNFYMFAVK